MCAAQVGGTEAAFLSATLDSDAALDHAAGGSGYLLEVQQTMAERGADLSLLSQYPPDPTHGALPHRAPPTRCTADLVHM